jgi:hypothetical protein
MFSVSALMTLVGLACNAVLVVQFVQDGETLPSSAVHIVHAATTGILLVMLGFLTFTFTLLLHAVSARLTRSSTLTAGI